MARSNANAQIGSEHSGTQFTLQPGQVHYQYATDTRLLNATVLWVRLDVYENSDVFDRNNKKSYLKRHLVRDMKGWRELRHEKAVEERGGREAKEVGEPFWASSDIGKQESSTEFVSEIGWTGFQKWEKPWCNSV